jgi:hypothetical protein
MCISITENHFTEYNDYIKDYHCGHKAQVFWDPPPAETRTEGGKSKDEGSFRQSRLRFEKFVHKIL